MPHFPDTARAASEAPASLPQRRALSELRDE
jgi:hypothetical protein